MSMPNPSRAEVLSSSSKVELHLSCRDLKNLDLLSKSDPFIVVNSWEGNSWKEVMRTATVWDNLNPDFADHIVIDYHFELVQKLRFEVYDRDGKSEHLKSHDFIGSVETALSRIMGGRGSTFSAYLKIPGQDKVRGRLIVKGEEVSSCKDLLTMQLAAKKLTRKNWFGLGRSDPFYTISRSREDGSYVKVWESETIKNTIDPIWSPVKIPVQRICNGDIDRPIQLHVYDWESNGDHKLIGFCTTSLRAFEKGKNLVLSSDPIKKKKCGELYVMESVVTKRYTFLDYIRGGCELNLVVAIDFTASNGAPSLPTSLHHQTTVFNTSMFSSSRNSLNEYQKAILAIGQILQDYDSDNQFPVYGFGGAVNGKTEHCFPLTFDPQHPQVFGVHGIMEAYKNAFSYVSLSGPTLFSRILAMATQYAENNCSAQEQSYTVLLILTDGVINDMDQTIEQLVKASALPLSVIIVGVGQADFSNMEVLDADDNPLTYNGVQMARDIVQFVPFRRFADKHYQALAASTLEELPGQVVSYFMMKNIKPNAPTIASSRNLAIETSQRGLGNASSGADTTQGIQQPSNAPSAPPHASTAL